MLEFAALDAGVCRPLLTQMSKFANLLDLNSPPLRADDLESSPDGALATRCENAGRPIP